jgi:hypothetical protein
MTTGMYGGMTPTDCVRRFAAALAARDEAAATFCCTKAAWTSSARGAPAGLFRGAVAQGWTFQVGTVQTAPPRAAVDVFVHGPDQTPLQRAWLLLVARDTNHRIVGSTLYPRYVDHFLAGTVEGTTDWEALPSSEEAVRWGEAFCAQLRSDHPPTEPAAAGLFPLLASVYRTYPHTSVQLVGSARFEPGRRLGVGLRFEAAGHAPRDRWIGLHEHEGQWVPYAVQPNPGPELFLVEATAP